MTNINFTAYVPHTKKGPECEDAPPVSETGILVVCDGTGATGLNKHTVNGETHTSAYYGSRLVSDITTKYLREHYNDIISSVTGVFKDYRADGDTQEPDEQNEQPEITTDENKPESNEQPEEIPPLESIINGLAQTINRELTNFVEANGLSLEVRGASFKMLPTTLAALVYKQFEDP